MSINDNITNLLKCNNITEEELANELSICEEDIINWKNNKSEPNIKELKLLSKRFSISIDELVCNNKYVSSDKKDGMLLYYYL
jgi:transcriptional regulator with XRE-family HTH domain